MKKITSAQNPLIKKIVQLSKKSSLRRKENLAIFEGVHLAQEFLKSGKIPKTCIFSEEFKSGEITKLLSECQKNNFEIIQVSNFIFEKISQNKEREGVIFLIEISNGEEIDFRKSAIVLDGVQDPGNLGTILRSMLAFGVEQIICSENTVSAWSPKVLRSAMGAHFSLKIFENVNLSSVLTDFKIPTISTSLDAKKTLFEEDLSGECVWIFGNEGAGVSPEVQKMASKNIIIPHNPKVESLNVAMAATVCLSESYRQNLSKMAKNDIIES